MFSALKAKLYAVGALITIAFFAYVKWLHASNQDKKEKINDLKREAVVAKKVSEMEEDVAEYRGFQEAINIHSEELAMKTAIEAQKRKIDEDCSDSNYDTHNT